jgi:hypothetical protein
MGDCAKFDLPATRGFLPMILPRSLGVFLVLVCLSIPCNAAVIANWNFNSLSIPANAPPGSGGVPMTIQSSQGTGVLSLAGWGGNVDDFGGSTVNLFPGDTAGASLTLLEGANGNNSFIQLNNISFAGLQPVAISYATQGTGSGFTTGTWSWSTNGTTFTNIAGSVSPPASYALVNIDLSNIAALISAPNVSFRYTLSGATASSGNNRIDNLSITAVPEPSSLLILATSALAIPAFRRFRRNPLLASPSVQTPC